MNGNFKELNQGKYSLRDFTRKLYYEEVKLETTLTGDLSMLIRIEE